MMHTPDYELTLATLIYAASCFEDGEWAVLRELNFGEKEARALRDIPLSDIKLLSNRMRGNVLDIRLNRERFWLVLNEVEQERATEQLKTELVCREAPVDMMRQLFGMSDREYTIMRRRYRRPRNVGRPPEPDTETMDAIWHAWRRRNQDREPKTAVEWLELSEDTNIDLRTIWRFIRGTQRLEPTP